MAGMTLSDLTTKLFVEGCLAAIAGNAQGEMPMKPEPLTELQRADLGLAQATPTVFYPLPPSGVFFDMAGAIATVWFAAGDSDKALQKVEAAMKRAYPNTKQLGDDVDEHDKFLRKRSYQVDFGNSRLGLVELHYPAKGPRNFIARVTAQQRKN
ncbi:hypothetical protein [Terricaulis sp.]|uniref:hypothetical protein n=1 Tax=Terricaulis sp. TaxID=2768686 RepID=UPI003783684C